MTGALGLAGGLALFLYGMEMMNEGLFLAAGSRMKEILGRMTRTPFEGILTGTAVTGIIQSSSATTVMTVSLVEGKMLSLSQALWVIMGANIGTTVTGQLIAVNTGEAAPVIALCGVLLLLAAKDRKFKCLGNMIAGLGILFLGMNMMETAMKPLESSRKFVRLMTEFESPAKGILAGCVFTALIQSSSASVGILQALAESGMIAPPKAVFVLFGQNIGTCITAVIAAMSGGREAKQAALLHVMFNVAGTLLFSALCMLFPLAQWMGSLRAGNPAAQIADMHTIFNVATTLFLFPAGKWMVKAAGKIIPERKKTKG